MATGALSKNHINSLGTVAFVGVLMVFLTLCFDLLNQTYFEPVRLLTRNQESFGSLGLYIFYITIGFFTAKSLQGFTPDLHYIRKIFSQLYTPYLYAIVLIYVIFYITNPAINNIFITNGLSPLLIGEVIQKMFVFNPIHNETDQYLNITVFLIVISLVFPYILNRGISAYAKKVKSCVFLCILAFLYLLASKREASLDIFINQGNLLTLFKLASGFTMGLALYSVFRELKYQALLLVLSLIICYLSLRADILGQYYILFLMPTLTYIVFFTMSIFKNIPIFNLISVVNSYYMLLFSYFSVRMAVQVFPTNKISDLWWSSIIISILLVYITTQVFQRYISVISINKQNK